MPSLTPNFGQVQARYGIESERPNLWTGLQALWTPPVTPTGLTWRDRSMHRSDGTLTNMDPASDWVMSPYGWALDFDATDDYVELSYLAVVSPPFSVAIFAKSDLDHPGLLHSLADAGQTAHAQDLWVDSGSLYCGSRAGGTWASSSKSYTVGKWTLFTGVWASSTWRCAYVDGVAGVVNTTARVPDAPTREWIGRAADSTPVATYDGKIALVLVYNRILLPAEIADLAADPFAMLRRRQVVIPSGVNRRRRVLLGAVT